MVYIDTNKPDRELIPGVDLWEVIQCSHSRSQAGTDMLKLKFARVSNSSDHLFDNIMLDGGGWSIGKQKLAALVDPGFAGDIDPLDFVGRRLWLETGVQEYTKKDGGKGQSLKVLIEGLKHAGYQREDDPPPGKSVPAKTDAEEFLEDSEETPF